MNFYVGSYSSASEGTLHEVNFDALIKSEQVGEVYSSIDAGQNPSFVCVHNTERVLYAVNELDENQDGGHGRVIALREHGHGEYEKISDCSTFGNYPCHVSVHQSGKLLFVANYGSSSLCTYKLEGNGGIGAHVQTYEFSKHFVETGPHATRQKQSRAHQALCAFDGAHLLVSDLGCDCIYTFAVAEQEEQPLKLVHINPAPRGSGPRHMVFSACKNYLYVSAELSSCLLVFGYNVHTGELTFLHAVPMFSHEASPYPRTYAAEVAQHGRYVYISNRGDDSVSIFNAEQAESPKLVHNMACGGKTPRHFKIFSQAYWGGEGTLVLANQDSDSLVFFAIVGDTLVEKQRIENIKSPSVVC